jgi:hypothetical protein
LYIMWRVVHLSFSYDPSLEFFSSLSPTDLF